MNDWYEDADGTYLPASADAWDELFENAEKNNSEDDSTDVQNQHRNS
jgi:hypothetical protein